MGYDVTINNDAIVVNVTNTPISVTVAGVGPQGPMGIDGPHALLTNNPHSVTKAQVGLGNADNTSDANKPVSTAQATADALVASNAASDATSKANAAQSAAIAASTPVAHNTNTSNPHSVTKAQVGLGNADNTSDADKPVSAAQTTAISLKLDATHAGTGGTSHADVIAAGAAGFMTGADKTKLDGIATGANNYVHPANHAPSIVTQDASNRFVTDAEKSTWSGKEDALAVGTAAQYYRGDKSWQTLNSAAVSLGSVDNTSDANKPVSTAQATAIALKQSTSEKGAANGYASLDAGGKVPTAQLPAYVDDVLEYVNLVGFPATGTAGIIYVALDTNKTYRWSGSAYVYITSGAVDSVAGKTGIVTLVKDDVGLSNVDNTSNATERAATATLTNKTIVAANNTITTAASGNLSATSLNAALAELQTDIDTRALNSALTTHTGDTTTAHGVTGAVVGTTNTQTLTNKIISAANNTITTAASGNLAATSLNAALAGLQGDIDTRQVAATAVTKTSATGSAILPSGTTAERDGTPGVGYKRFNTTLGKEEVWNGTAWVAGGGATGGSGDECFYLNSQTVDHDFTIPAGKNAMSAGGASGIAIANGVTVTISTGSSWVIV